MVSPILARQFAALVRKFGFEPGAYSVEYEGKMTLYHVYLNGGEDLEKFKLRVSLTDPAKKEQVEAALRR